MRIAYFARIDVGYPSGVLKKITRQIKHWEAQGNEVKLFALSQPCESPTHLLDQISVTYFTTKNYLDLFIKAVPVELAIGKWKPDIVFLRYSSYYPFLYSLVLKKTPTILDVNSNYDKEYKRIHHKLAYFFHRTTKDFFYQNVAGFTTLTGELAAWLSRYNKPVAIIGDSIDLSEISLLPPSSESGEPQLICFASKPYPWIALDKIFLLAESFKNWRVHIIGLETEDIPQLTVPDNVLLHGFMNKENYQQILQNADIAIGTLGLHRIGLSEMAPLKLREYLAYGLPSIIAYRDTDFLNGAPFLLELPNEEKNISTNLKRIKNFVINWKGKRVSREEISFIDVAYKEESRLAFFQSILSKNNKARL